MKRYTMDIKVDGRTIEFTTTAESEAEATQRAEKYARIHDTRVNERGIVYSHFAGGVPVAL